MDPTLAPAERCLIRAYLACGSLKVAAEQCGVRYVRARQLLSALYRRDGLANITQAVWRHRDELEAA